MRKKKRYLRPTIEKALKIATITLFIIGASIDDFNMEALPIIIGIWATVAINIWIINKWGRPEDGRMETSN